MRAKVAQADDGSSTSLRHVLRLIVNIPEGSDRPRAESRHDNPMTKLMTLTGNWNYPTSVRFGPGRIRELADACKAVGLKRPLLVTDPGLSGLPMIADAVALCRSAGLGVDGVRQGAGQSGRAQCRGRARGLSRGRP